MKSHRPPSGWITRVAALAGTLLVSALLFAAFVQPRIAEWGSTEAERQATWPGDSFTPSPGFVWTNGITIDAPAAAIWPWLAQWGQGRAGLYSYDWLENALGCGIDSRSEIVPQYQHPLAVGSEEIRMCRYAPANPIAVFEPGRALVMGAPGDASLATGRASSTWAFILDPVDEDTTRLIVRSRADSLMTP